MGEYEEDKIEPAKGSVDWYEHEQQPKSGGAVKGSVAAQGDAGTGGVSKSGTGGNTAQGASPGDGIVLSGGAPKRGVVIRQDPYKQYDDMREKTEKELASLDAEDDAKSLKKNVKDYRELYDTLSATTKDEEKRDRRNRLFSAIGDGVSALSNLFFTTQYSPNMYDGNATLSGKARERWDKLVAERKANALAAVKMEKMNEDKAYRDAVLAREQNKDKRERLRKRLERIMPYTEVGRDAAKRKQEMELEKARELAKIKKDSDMDLESKKSKNRKDEMKLKHDYDMALARVKEDKSGEKEYEFEGNTYRTRDGWEAAIRKEYANLGGNVYAEERTTEYNRNGKVTGSKRVTKLKPIGLILKDIHKMHKEQEQQTPTANKNWMNGSLGWGNSNKNDNETDW